MQSSTLEKAVFKVLLVLGRLVSPGVEERILESRRDNRVPMIEKAATESGNCPVLKNGSTTKWLLGEHKEGEEIFLMCECGWVSLPILIFKEYFHYVFFKEELSPERRIEMSSRIHLLEVMGKVKSFCPHCQKLLEVKLETRPS